MRTAGERCSRWIGADISGNILRHAKQYLEGKENIELIELSTVGLMEIPTSSIDLVYCTVVFMHLYEWDRYKYVEEAFRVLRLGGRCFFDNVDIKSEEGWKVFMESCDISKEQRPAHVTMTSTGDELETYAIRTGFKEAKIHRWDNTWVGVTGIKQL